MKDHGLSINISCPCRQPHCPIRGNCVLCVQNHLTHKRHLPECIQNLLRRDVESLARMMELTTTDARPLDAHWIALDKKEFLRQTLARHPGKGGKKRGAKGS